MKVQVRALGGIERADIEVSHVALIVGQTGAGKSSIIEAARAAVTNDWHVRGITKKGDLSGFIHAGYDSGKVRVSEDDAQATMQFPGCEYETAGTYGEKKKPIWSTEVAAGLVNPLDADTKTRTQFFIEILAASPSKADLIAALGDVGLKEELALNVWVRIEESNWDTAQTHYATRATELKGQWEGVSKDRWGKRKGENFLPQGWDETLMTASQQSLEGIVARAKKKLEEYIATTAVDEDRRSQLQEKADKLEALRSQLFTVDQAASKAKLAADEADKALKALPEPEQEPKTVDCPHCGAECGIDVSSGDIVLTEKPKTVSKKENAARVAAQEDAREALTAARTELRDADEMATKAQRLVRDAESAQEELKSLPEGGDTDEAKLNTARTLVTESETRLAMFKAKAEADRIHRSITLNLAVADELKPEGLRKRKLVDAIEVFNKTIIAPLSEKIDGVRCYFDSSTLEGRMETIKGTRNYRMLSRGEKVVFQSILQFAVAEKDGSSLVLIDDADAVQGGYRAGLVKMALSAATPSIIAMAVRVKEQVPDLSKTRKGTTYWVDNKTATDVSEMKEE